MTSGPHLEFRQLVKLNYAAGWTDAKRLVIATAVEIAEGNGYPERVHVNDDGSEDWGLWQINNVWHPEVTQAQAFDPVWSTAWARKVYVAHGGSFNTWNAYKNDAYLGPRAMGYACPAVGNWLREQYGFL